MQNYMKILHKLINISFFPSLWGWETGCQLMILLGCLSTFTLATLYFFLCKNQTGRGVIYKYKTLVLPYFTEGCPGEIPYMSLGLHLAFITGYHCCTAGIVYWIEKITGEKYFHFHSGVYKEPSKQEDTSFIILQQKSAPFARQCPCSPSAVYRVLFPWQPQYIRYYTTELCFWFTFQMS